MNLTISDVLSWMIIGGFAGSLVGMMVKRRKKGWGHLVNLGVGLVGAIIGGGAIRVFKVDFGIGEIVLRWEDMVAALIGSFVLIGCIAIARRKQQKEKDADA